MEERAELTQQLDQQIKAYAHKVCRFGWAEYDDVLQDGRIGALDAAARWDPDRGAFSTFAWHRIRGEITDGMRRRDVISRSARQQLDQDDPRAASSFLSLDATMGSDQDDLRLGDVIPDSDPGPEYTITEAAYLTWQVQEIDVALKRLTGFERDVVRAYFWGGLTLWQIGERMGFTESRACQILNKAVGIMTRTMMARDELTAC